jgi:hypothetical protein
MQTKNLNFEFWLIWLKIGVLRAKILVWVIRQSTLGWESGISCVSAHTFFHNKTTNKKLIENFQL